MTTLRALLDHITPEQLDRCRRLWDDNRQEWFYLVESESDALKEYTVRFGPARCSCPAGQEGFRNCHRPGGTCKHYRWAFKAEELYQQEQAQ